MKIKKINLCNLGIFLLLLICFTKSFFKILYNGNMGVNIFLILSALLIIGIKSKKNSNKSVKNLTYLWISFLFIIIIFNNYDIKEKNILMVFQYLVGTIVIIFLQKNNNWCEKNIKYIKIFVLLHFFIGFILMFNVNFVITKIVPLFKLEKGYYYDSIINQIKSGYLTGLTSHYSIMGIYLSIGLCYFAGNIFNNKRQVTFKSLMGIILMLIGVVLSGKRSALLFPTLSVLITYSLFFKSRNLTKRMKYALVLMFLVLICAIFFILNPDIIQNSSIGRFTSVFQEKDLNRITNTRYTMLWEPAIQLFNRNKIFGIGWGNFKYSFSQYLTTEVRGNNTHNVYLQILCETGIVGFILIYTIFISTFIHTINILRRWNKEKLKLTDLEVEIFGISLTIQIYFFLYSLSGNPLYDIQFYLIYVLSITMGFATERNLKIKEV